MAQSDQFDLSNFKPPNISGRNILWIFVAIIILLFIWQSWFTVNPEEVGIILRFGKYTRQAPSGLNFKIPFGVEDVIKVPVERQIKQEFGFRTLRAGVRSEYAANRFQDESLMLTGDLNAAQVEWIVQYRISDPYKYLFKVRNAETTFRDITEAVMRNIVGDRTVNEVLTVGRQEIALAVEVKIQELCDSYETGIKVDQVVLQDVNPPDEVKPSFNEVNEAQQEKEKLINQARSEYNKVIPKAKGEAQRQIEEARGYALERVNNAKGDAERFKAQFREYARAREVTRQRLYLETLNEVMSKVGRKLITDDKASGILPLFNLEKGGLNDAK
ncbi:MAG: FtsH protease activity modulator HflK [Calditrichaceae bacterium]|nr:FtsH protease activity modulator HflK [Calditrichaceae bacterium]